MENNSYQCVVCEVTEQSYTVIVVLAFAVLQVY